MENIKYKLNLLKENHMELRKAEIYCHILLFGYILTQLKKRFKSKKQMIINERWRKNNKEKYNEIKRKAFKLRYHNDENFRDSKKKIARDNYQYQTKKEFKLFLNINL